MRRQPLAASLAVACSVMVAVGLTAMVVTDQKTRAINDRIGITNEKLAKGPVIVSALVCSKDCREVASAVGEERSDVCLINSHSGIELKRLSPLDYLPGDFVRNLAYSPNVDRLAIAINNRIVVWTRVNGPATGWFDA